MRIERLIPCAPRDLWSALIQHAELGEQGAILRLGLPCGIFEGAGRITAYQSQQLLECAWGSDVLRWELQARDGMTLLVFTSAEHAGEWLAYIDHIAALATAAGDAAFAG